MREIDILLELYKARFNLDIVSSEACTYYFNVSCNLAEALFARRPWYLPRENFSRNFQYEIDFITVFSDYSPSVESEALYTLFYKFVYYRDNISCIDESEHGIIMRVLERDITDIVECAKEARPNQIVNLFLLYKYKTEFDPLSKHDYHIASLG